MNWPIKSKAFMHKLKGQYCIQEKLRSQYILILVWKREEKEQNKPQLSTLEDPISKPTNSRMGSCLSVSLMAFVNDSLSVHLLHQSKTAQKPTTRPPKPLLFFEILTKLKSTKPPIPFKTTISTKIYSFTMKPTILCCTHSPHSEQCHLNTCIGSPFSTWFPGKIPTVDFLGTTFRS